MTEEKLSVFGSFGYGNLGDELVPHCFADLLASLGAGQTPAILSRFDKPLPVDGVLRLTEGRRMIAAGTGVQRIFVVGGGIVEPSSMSCMNRAFEMVKGVPNAQLSAFAISVEPGVRFGFRQRRRLRAQLDILGPVAVRDQLSARTLAELAPGHPVETVGDIALWSRPGVVPPEVAARIGGTPGIVVILQTTWPEAEVFPWLVEELSILARGLRLPVTVLPFAAIEEEDRRLHARLAAELRRHAPDIDVFAPAEIVPQEELTLGAIAAILAEARLCISMRLHGCIVAYAQRTPFVALAYHPKLRGFTETVNWQSALLPGHPPRHQTKGVYGYRFADLALGPGDLVGKAEEMMAQDDFTGIDFYRRRQQVALSERLQRGR